MTYPFPYKTLDGIIPGAPSNDEPTGPGSDFPGDVTVAGDLEVGQNALIHEDLDVEGEIVTDRVRSHEESTGLDLVSTGTGKRLRLMTNDIPRMEIFDDYTKINQTQNVVDFDGNSGALRVAGGAFIGEDLIVAGEIITQGPSQAFNPTISADGTVSINVTTSTGNFVQNGDTFMFDFFIACSYENATGMTVLMLSDLPIIQSPDHEGYIGNVYSQGLIEPVGIHILSGTDDGVLKHKITGDNIVLNGTGSFFIGGTGFMMEAGVSSFTPTISAGGGTLGTIIYGVPTTGCFQIVGNVVLFSIHILFIHLFSSATDIRVSLPSTATYDSFVDNIGTDKLEYPLVGDIVAGTNYISLKNPATGLGLGFTGDVLDNVLMISGFYFNDKTDFTPTLIVQSGDAGTLNYSSTIGYRSSFGQAIFATVNLSLTYTDSDIQQYSIQMARLAAASKAVLTSRSTIIPTVYVGGSFVEVDENYSKLIGTGSFTLQFSQLFIGSTGTSTTASFNAINLTKPTGYALQSNSSISITEPEPSKFVNIGNHPDEYSSIVDFLHPGAGIPVVHLGRSLATGDSMFIGFIEDHVNPANDKIKIGFKGIEDNALILDKSGNLSITGVLSTPGDNANFFKILFGGIPNASVILENFWTTNPADIFFYKFLLTIKKQKGYYVKNGDIVNVSFDIEYSMFENHEFTGSVGPKSIYFTNLPYRVHPDLNASVDFGQCKVGNIPDGVIGSITQPIFGIVGSFGEEDTVARPSSAGLFDGYTFKPYYRNTFAPGFDIPSFTIPGEFHWETIDDQKMQGSFEYITDGTFNPNFET